MGLISYGEEKIYGDIDFFENVGITKIGHHVAEKSGEGHMHFFAHNEFTDGLTVVGPQVINSYSYTEKLIYQSDESGDFTGTNLEYTFPSAGHILANKFYYKTGTTAATQPVRIRVWEGTDDTGTLILDQTYPASEFPASTEISLTTDGYSEYDANTTYFLRYSSDANFSLKMDATNTMPWLAADTSLLREEDLFCTKQWVSGDTWTAGDYYIDNIAKKIYVCNTTGVQTGTFAENSAYWDLLSSTANDFWDRSGTTVSLTNSGDDVSLSGDLTLQQTTPYAPTIYMGPTTRANNGNIGELSFMNGSTQVGFINVFMNDYSNQYTEMRFGTYGSGGIGEHLYLHEDGKLSLGTNVASHTLEVDGDGRFSSDLTLNNTSSKSTLYFNSGAVGNAEVGAIEFQTNATTIGEMHVAITDSTNDYGEFRFSTKGSTGLQEWLYLGAEGLLESYGDAAFYQAVDITGDLTVDTNTLFVDVSADEVGINTTNPKTTLHIVNGGVTTGMTTVPAGRGLAITGGLGQSRLYFENTVNTSGERVFQISNNEDHLRFQSLTDTAASFVQQYIMSMSHDTGYVGIGTGVPEYPLHVSHASAGYALIETDSNSGDTGLLFRNSSGEDGYVKAGIFFENDGSGWGRGDLHFALENSASTSNVDATDSIMTILHEGYVGIGTSTPEAALHVYENTSSYAGTGLLIEQAGSDDAFMKFKIASGQSFQCGIAYNETGEPFKFTEANGSVEYLSLHESLFEIPDNVDFSVDTDTFFVDASTDYVGIGTSTPSAELDVVGDTELNGDLDIPTGTVTINTGQLRAYGPTGVVSNFVAGHQAGTNLTEGAGDTLVGYYAGGDLTTGTSNTLIGYNAGQNLSTQNFNTYMGQAAGGAVSDSNRVTGIGVQTFVGATGISYSTGLGMYAGYNSSGQGGTYLGYNAGHSETENYKLHISSYYGDLIEGSFYYDWLNVHGSVNTPFGGFGHIQNYCRQTENLSVSPWIDYLSYTTITANNATAPNGTTTADTVKWTTLGRGLRHINLGTSDSTKYTVSFWARAVTQSLQTLTLSLHEGTSGDVIISDKGIQRYVITLTSGTADDVLDLTYNGTVDDEFEFWGFQVNDGGAPYSYVKTEATSYSTADYGASVMGNLYVYDGISTGAVDLTGNITTTNSSTSHNVFTFDSNASGNADVGDIDFQTNSTTISRITGQVTDATNDYGSLIFTTKDSDGTVDRMAISDEIDITGATNITGNTDITGTLSVAGQGSFDNYLVVSDSTDAYLSLESTRTTVGILGSVLFEKSPQVCAKIDGYMYDSTNKYTDLRFYTYDADGTVERLHLEADANVITGDTNIDGNLEFDDPVGYYTLSFNSDVSGAAELGRISFETGHIETAYMNTKITDDANDYAKLLFFTKDSDGLSQRLQIKKDATEINGTTTVYGQLNITTTTGAVRFPNMTTTQRGSLSPSAGDTIFNTTTSKLECYDGSVWNAAW
jgi:hypothetical protein